MRSRAFSAGLLRSLLVAWLTALLTPASSQAAPNLNIRLVSNVKPSANPLSYGDVWAENDIACLGVWLNYSAYNYGVGIFTLTNPAAPSLLCRVGATTGNVTNGFDRVHTIWLERNFLYEAAHVAGTLSVK